MYPPPSPAPSAPAASEAPPPVQPPCPPRAGASSAAEAPPPPPVTARKADARVPSSPDGPCAPPDAGGGAGGGYGSPTQGPPYGSQSSGGGACDWHQVERIAGGWVRTSEPGIRTLLLWWVRWMDTGCVGVNVGAGARLGALPVELRVLRRVLLLLIVPVLLMERNRHARDRRISCMPKHSESPPRHHQHHSEQKRLRSRNTARLSFLGSSPRARKTPPHSHLNWVLVALNRLLNCRKGIEPKRADALAHVQQQHEGRESRGCVRREVLSYVRAVLDVVAADGWGEQSDRSRAAGSAQKSPRTNRA